MSRLRNTETCGNCGADTENEPYALCDECMDDGHGGAPVVHQAPDPALVDACRVALVTFERYADHHAAKGADGKAAANRALAETMRQALRKAGVEP